MSGDVVLLARRAGALDVLREIAEGFQSATDLGPTLRTVLVGATAGQGLRFNRAFVLLVDRRTGTIRGRDGIGPSDEEEARRIWKELDARPHRLTELLRDFRPLLECSKGEVRGIVDRLRADSGSDGFLVRALAGKRTVRVVDGVADPPPEPDLLEILGVRDFVAVPLVAQGHPAGLLLADNAITRRPFEDDDVFLLELLGILASLAIERSLMVEELAAQVEKLERATRELRETQERRVQAERLTAVGEMAAKVVHEIRNPLAAIGGFARTLLREDEEARRREALGIIVDEVRRLEGIVGEVLETARPAPAAAEPVDLAVVAREVAALLPAEGIVMEVAPEGDPPRAQADGDAVHRALLDLARNAVEAMPDGGRVVFRIRGRAPHGVEIAVEDEGPGIPPEVRKRALEPFFTTKAWGTGLGLSVAAEVAREQGGGIAIEDREGGGARVVLSLPAADTRRGRGGLP